MGHTLCGGVEELTPFRHPKYRGALLRTVFRLSSLLLIVVAITLISAAPAEAKAKKRRRGRGFHGQAVTIAALRQDAPPRPSGDLHLVGVNFHEELKVNIYNPDGSFNRHALHELDMILRCRRTNTAKPIDPRLYETLSAIQDKFGGRRIFIISGFRNQRKTTSFHFHATATDIRVEDVDPKVVRDFAQTLDTGGMGIGYYPNSGFVHIDVRPQSFRWTDYSGTKSRKRGLEPPRGFRRRPNA